MKCYCCLVISKFSVDCRAIYLQDPVQLTTTLGCIIIISLLYLVSEGDELKVL